MTAIGSRKGGTPAALYVNGQQIGYVSEWEFEITTETVDGSDMWGKRYFPGRQSATITLNGIDMTRLLPEPAPARDDTVMHLGTRCCCRHCPEGGNHA